MDREDALPLDLEDARYRSGVPDADRPPYNPLDRVELGKSVERALMRCSLTELVPFMPRRPRSRRKFPGAGLYALYYTGSVGCYQRIALSPGGQGEVPIYVGRARPKGARQGAAGLDSTTSDPVVFDRLREHARSIQTVANYAATNGRADLAVKDFMCRYLVVDDIWVPLGETLLIGHYRPVWNVVLDGFGNHGPGGGRANQARSPWDTLHPGRPWASRLPESDHPREYFWARVIDHLNTFTPLDLDTVPDVPDIPGDRADG